MLRREEEEKKALLLNTSQLAAGFFTLGIHKENDSMRDERQDLTTVVGRDYSTSALPTG